MRNWFRITIYFESGRRARSGHLLRCLWVCCAVGVILLQIPGAHAADPAADCDSLEPERKIRGCTALIESGDLQAVALSEALNKRGIAFVMMGLLQAAFADFSTAIHFDPGNPKPYVNRGGVHMRWGQTFEAKINYEKAIELDPNFARAYAGRGIARLLNEQYGAAIDDMNDAIRLDPTCALHYNNRGVAYENIGEIGKAIADFRKALELDPDLDVAKRNFMRLTRGASAPTPDATSKRAGVSDHVAGVHSLQRCPG